LEAFNHALLSESTQFSILLQSHVELAFGLNPNLGKLFCSSDSTSRAMFNRE